MPGSSLLLQGTKDGIIYSLDKYNLGRNERFKWLMSKPPLVASYYGGDTAEKLCFVLSTSETRSAATPKLRASKLIIRISLVGTAG